MHYIRESLEGSEISLWEVSNKAQQFLCNSDKKSKKGIKK